MNKSTRLTLLERTNSVKALALLAFTVWFAYVFHFKSFGFYEDDYFNIVPSLGKDVSYLLEIVKVFFTWLQGRPIGFFVLYSLTFIGDKLGGLSALYLILFIIITLNSYLFYRLLKLNYPEFVALAGALAFCLFPADGAKSLLNNVFAGQTALTFLLSASLCYLTDKKQIAYWVSLGSLLSYETTFIVFFGVPLLKDKWNRHLIRELAKHAIVLIGMIFVVLVVRRMTGEGGDQRVASAMANFFSDWIPLKMLLSPFIGSATSLSMFFRAPYATIKSFQIANQQIYISCAVCFLVFIWFFSRLKPVRLPERVNVLLSSQSQTFISNDSFWSFLQNSKIARFFLAGIILLCLSYVLVFRQPYYPPSHWTTGRLSSGAHIAATFGASIIFASIVYFVISLAISFNKKRIYISIILALYYSLLVGYFFQIQLDFKQSWHNQQVFWTSVIEQCPDMKQETVIFVEAKNLPQTKFPLTYSAVFLTLQHIYKFPEVWLNSNSLPLVLLVGMYTENWIQDELQWKGDQLIWHGGPEWKSHQVEKILSSSNVILLRMVDEKITRINEPILVKGKVFNLKQRQPFEAHSWQKGPLFNYLIIGKKK